MQLERMQVHIQCIWQLQTLHSTELTVSVATIKPSISCSSILCWLYIPLSGLTNKPSDNYHSSQVGSLTEKHIYTQVRLLSQAYVCAVSKPKGFWHILNVHTNKFTTMQTHVFVYVHS